MSKLSNQDKLDLGLIAVLLLVAIVLVMSMNAY